MMAFNFSFSVPMWSANAAEYELPHKMIG